MLGRTGQGAGRAQVMALLLLALALCAGFLPLAQAHAAAKAQAKADEHPADAPVRRFQTLLARKKISLEVLRTLETELEQAKKVRPAGADGAKAGFFLARVQQETAKLTKRKADWAKAADTFGQCAERFPKYILAPDALLHRGVIRLERLGDPEGAKADFQAVVRGYPRSRAAKAAAVRAQKAALVPAARKAEPPAPAQAAAPQAGHGDSRASGKAELLEVRVKNTSKNARVVLELDSRVKYRYQLLEVPGGKDVAGRVYVDLLGARPRPGLSDDNRCPRRHSARGARGPKDGDDTRVVMEFSEIKDYRVTVLDAPFRLIIDAYGTQEAKAAAPPPPVDEGDAPPFSRPRAAAEKMAANLVEQLGLTVRTVMVDAGHGGKDPGAQGFGLREKDVNLRMALILGKMLKQRGFKVLYTRTTDDFLALEERTALANGKKADLFVSVHCNAHTDPTMQGFETYSLNLARTPDAVRVAARENAVATGKNISDLQMILTDLMLTSKIKESVDLARTVHRSGLSSLNGKWRVVDHGHREAPFYVLMGAKMPSILLEIGYITNKTEAARLKGDAYLKTLAGGIAQGIVGYKMQIEGVAAR
jgi:N-acetylmuramoyl-L-alanine amidase